MTESLYDHPAYYELVFGSDWKAEFAFLRACFERWATRPVRRVFEPACGTGRLLFRLAKAGYEVGGLDLNPRAVAYCNRRLERHGFPPSIVVGDMRDFALRRPVDACFNMINSFRHLTSESDAAAHLHCVARSLRPGGLYVLGLHLTPQSVPEVDEERWSARRGHLQVNTCLRRIGRAPRRRLEYFEMVCDVYTPTTYRQLREVLPFRSYTHRQFQSLLARIPPLEIIETYDFAYDVEYPIQVDGTTVDVVYILRRRGGKGRRGELE